MASTTLTSRGPRGRMAGPDRIRAPARLGLHRTREHDPCVRGRIGGLGSGLVPAGPAARDPSRVRRGSRMTPARNLIPASAHPVLDGDRCVTHGRVGGVARRSSIQQRVIRIDPPTSGVDTVPWQQRSAGRRIARITVISPGPLSATLFSTPNEPDPTTWRFPDRAWSPRNVGNGKDLGHPRPSTSAARSLG